jgi:hypothetical protein
VKQSRRQELHRVVVIMAEHVSMAIAAFERGYSIEMEYILRMLKDVAGGLKIIGEWIMCPNELYPDHPPCTEAYLIDEIKKARYTLAALGFSCPPFPAISLGAVTNGRIHES